MIYYTYILCNIYSIIGINRPKRFNAFNDQQYSDFGNALIAMDNDSNINVIAVTGNGKYFSSGNDLSEFAKAFTAKVSPKQLALLAREKLLKFTTSIINVRKPIICGVNGPALGIAVTMLNLFDIVYASNTATFQTPFSSLGQSPEGLSSYEFPKVNISHFILIRYLLYLYRKWVYQKQVKYCY